MSRQKPTLYDAFRYVPGRTSSPTSMAGRPLSSGVHVGGLGPILLIAVFCLGAGFLGGYHFRRPSPGSPVLDARLPKREHVVRIATYAKPAPAAGQAASRAAEDNRRIRMQADKAYVESRGFEFKLFRELSENGESYWACIKPAIIMSPEQLAEEVKAWTDDKGRRVFPDVLVVAAP